MSNRFGFDRIIKNFEQVKTTLPQVLANDTKNFFLRENFDKQQFNGVAWADVKRHGKKGGSQRNQSASLVQSGKLRRAVANSLLIANWNEIVFSVRDSTAKDGFNYGGIHNYGGHAGRGASFEMPKRQFIGDSAALREKQLAAIKRTVDKIWSK